jgi:ABC-type transport system involved in cytochrome c biogenesis permease subunit
MSSNARPKTGRWIAFVVTLTGIGMLFLMLARSLMPEKEVVVMLDYTAWSPEVIAEASKLPVQDGGRVKPLETFASYTMLKMRGDRRVRIERLEEEVVEVRPVAWLLDILFRPQMAIKTPSFRVDNSDVLKMIGVKGKEKRDRYSYVEIADARERLMELSANFLVKQQNKEKLDPSQSQTLDLARKVSSYELLLGYFSFAREGVELKGAEAGGALKIQRVSSIMETANVIRQVIKEREAAGQPIPEHVQGILQQVTYLSNLARGGRGSLLLFPPTGNKEDEPWHSAGDQIFGVMTGALADPELGKKDIVGLEYLYGASDSDQKEFVSALGKLRDDVETRADKRGDLASVKWEQRFNKGKWFFRAMFYCFLPGILFLILSWLKPDGLWGGTMTKLVWGFCVVGLLLVITGTTLRSIVMQRPPVGNLYDTMPYITIGSVLLALVVEGLTRRRMALGLAPIIGFVGLAMARMYEFGEGQDPMDPLVAVLRSNYWLTIHVLTITLGYAAGLIAAGFGMTFLFRKVFGLYGEDEKSERRAITRMTYGTLCFTLFLSLVGTVLGGVWANYSWGRFWGWDPKENGALLLVLWTLFVLHGRVGGYLREWGLNLCAIFTGMVVTFSWWHVNLLGVGLHSYGFSDSKLTAVMSVYKLLGIILLIGIGYAIWEKEAKRKKKAQAKAA